MQNVEVIQLGHLIKSQLSLEKVVKFANGAQSYFKFNLSNSITNIGDPNKNGKYKTGFLTKLINDTKTDSKQDIRVGVIDYPLWGGLFSGINKDCNCIIISIHNIDGIIKDTWSTYEAYVLTEIAVQLLTIKYRISKHLIVKPEKLEKPWHRQTKSCLFDYCEIPAHTRRKLIAPNICDSCQESLSIANIPGPIKKACIEIFNSGVKTRFSTIFRVLPNNKIITVLFSGSIGGLIIFFIDKVFINYNISFIWIPIVILIILVLVMVPYKIHKDYTNKIKT